MDGLKYLVVDAEWDDEAKVWVATSGDVPGLVTEADTIELLELKLKQMIPELLELNGIRMGAEVPISLVARRREILRLSA